MDYRRMDFHNTQLWEVGAVLFDHCKCDIRFCIPLIDYFAMCLLFEFVISATVMNLRYILHM